MLSVWMNSQLPILAPAAPELPQVLNGGFDSGANWTLTQGGGAGTISIGSGFLTYSGGSLGSGPLATQTLTGLADFAGQDVVFTFDYITATRAFVVSLGGGTEVSSVAGVSGTGLTITVTVGSSNENLRIRASSPLSGGWSIDNVSIALA